MAQADRNAGPPDEPMLGLVEKDLGRGNDGFHLCVLPGGLSLEDPDGGELNRSLFDPADILGAAVVGGITVDKVRAALDAEVVLDALRRAWPKATAGRSDAELAARVAKMTPDAAKQLAGHAFEGWDAAISNVRSRLSGGSVRIELADAGTAHIDGWMKDKAGNVLFEIQHKARLDNSDPNVRDWLAKLKKGGKVRVPKDAVGDGLANERVARSAVTNKDLGRAVENAGRADAVGAVAGSLHAAAKAVPVVVLLESVFGVYGVATETKTAEDAAEDVLWDGMVATFVTVAATGLVTTGIAAVSPAAVPALLISLPVGFVVVPLVGVAREHIDTTTITAPAAAAIAFVADLSPVEASAKFVDNEIVRPVKTAGRKAAKATVGFVDGEIVTPAGKAAKATVGFVDEEVVAPMGKAAKATARFVGREIFGPVERTGRRISDGALAFASSSEAIVVDTFGVATLPS